MRVLVVEDEPKLADNIAQILKEGAGFAVDVCNDGLEGLHLAMNNPYDLIVLDLMLPGMSGLELLGEMRKKGKDTAVLILTAKNTSTDIIEGLNCGSDDYLTKPFDIGELIARCKALVRRSYQKPNPEITIGNIKIHTLSRSVEVAEQSVDLTAMEYKTLEFLALRSGEVVTKSELLEHLYDFNWERFSNVIEAHISSLRRKLDPDRKNNPIKTIRGHGYILKGD